MIAMLRQNDRTLAPAIVALLLAATAGALMASSVAYAPLLIAGCAAALVSTRWRDGVVVLLCALPFAGAPAFVAGEPGLAVRDLCVVAPVYAGFAIEMTRSGDRALPAATVAMVALGLFAALVVVQVLRAPNALSGAIGARVWLAYLPMLAIGYRFARWADGFEAILRITALLGLVPASIALAECAYAVGRGDFGPLENLYGAWQLTETQRFVVFTTGDAHLRVPRVPATFTGVTQYFGFSLVAFAAALGMAYRRGGAWALCALVLAAGALASGARAGYVAVPAIAVLSFVLSGPLRSRPHAFVVAGACYVLFALIIGSAIAGIAQAVPSHVVVSLRAAADELTSSFSLFGHGTGWDTNAALRYGGVDERRYIENWYAKAMLELGVAGLACIVIAFAAFAAAAWRALRSLDPETKRLAAPTVALLAVAAVLLLKGPYIDLDPLNVYFWLLLGAVFGLADGARETARDEEGGAR
jgi:hypothetical protein